MNKNIIALAILAGSAVGSVAQAAGSRKIKLPPEILSLIYCFIIGITPLR